MSRSPDAPPSAPIEDPQPGRYELAGRGRRLANYLVDAGGCAMVAILLAVIVASSAGRDIEKLLDGAGLYVFSYTGELLYYVSCESLTGRTLGKLITGTRTVGLDGRKPGFERTLVRTLVRFVPLEFLTFLGDAPVGWHDRWSGTRVVRV